MICLPGGYFTAELESRRFVFLEKAITRSIICFHDTNFRNRSLSGFERIMVINTSSKFCSTKLIYVNFDPIKFLPVVKFDILESEHSLLSNNGLGEFGRDFDILKNVSISQHAIVQDDLQNIN